MTCVQTGPSIWYGPEVDVRKEDWMFSITAEELTELSAAADNLVQASSKSLRYGFLDLSFLESVVENLPKLKKVVDKFLDSLLYGLGFAVWRGIPVTQWDREKLCAAFLIIGRLFGGLRQQNAIGHVLGHVKNLGLSSSDPNVRVYQTRERQTFHTDSSDIVGLMCLQSAKSGGMSSLVSSGTVFNEMIRVNKELAEIMLEPFPTDKRGEVEKGTLPFYNIPVYHQYEGYLSACYQRQYVNSSQRLPEAPRLSAKQIEALDLFDSLNDDPRLNFTMKLEPGDMQFVNNHALLHDRTAFEDWTDPTRKRHLLRVWMAPEGARPLPVVFSKRFGSVEVGNRGGVNYPGVASVAPLEAQ